MTAAPGPQQPDEVDRVAYGSLRGRPRVMGVCPSCGVANLALSEGLPYVVCGNLRCNDPTAPSNALGRTPAAPSAQPDEIERDDLAHLDTRELHEWTEQTNTPAQPDEVCGVRYPDSTEGYCPCARVSCDGRHRCLHGTTWGTPAQPVRDTEEGRRAPVQGTRPHRPPGTVAWEEHERAAADYMRRFPNGQDTEVLASRGGFDYGELTDHLGHEPRTWQPR